MTQGASSFKAQSTNPLLSVELLRSFHTKLFDPKVAFIEKAFYGKNDRGTDHYPNLLLKKQTHPLSTCQGNLTGETFHYK